MDPLVNPPNNVVDDIRDIALEPNVGPHIINNINAPQAMNPSPSNLKVTRPKKSIEGDSDYDHALINHYLWCPRPLIPKVNVGQD